MAFGSWFGPERQALLNAGMMTADGPLWRHCPQSTQTVGGFIALQGRWAVPWLMAVSGYTREVATGRSPRDAFRISFAVLLGSQVASWLWHLPERRPKPPSLNPGYSTVGGGDEAWLYRTHYLPTWESTGALEWLRQVGERRR